MNAKGMSLVELMVTLGLFGIAMVGTASLFVNQQKSIQSIRQKAELTDLMGDLKLIFSEPKLCAASLARVRLAPTEPGLHSYCYEGVDPVITPLPGPSAQPVKNPPGGIIRSVNGKKMYGSVVLKKFCLTWKSILDQTQDTAVQSPSAEPQSIRGLASLVFQGEREVGGDLLEQSMLVKVLLEKTPDSGRFNIKNMGNNFDRAEPTSDSGSPTDLTRVRPVKAAYGVKSCASEGSGVPDGDGDKGPKALMFVDLLRTQPIQIIADRMWGGTGNSPFTKVYFDVKREDSNSLYDVKTGRLTLPKGVWQITMSVYSYASAGSNQHLEADLYKNGAFYLAGPAFRNYVANSGAYISATVRSSGSDYFEMYVGYGNSSIDVQLSGSSSPQTLWMQAVRLGD